jgi:polyisoprenoid-binding protein YceI
LPKLTTNFFYNKGRILKENNPIISLKILAVLIVINMKKVIILLAAFAFTATSYAQVQFTRNGQIVFFSSTAVEDIKAQNNEVVSFLDTKKGEVRFQALVKGFIFPKAAMQQHFNSKQYMYSDSFPQASFKGNITNLAEINFSKNGTYKAKVKGELTMHGVTKAVTAEGNITIAGGAASVLSVFKVNREDFKIIVPAYMGSKIATVIEITVNCKYAPYKK